MSNMSESKQSNESKIDSLICPDCQSNDIVEDNFIFVCTNCGNVVNDLPESIFLPKSSNMKNVDDLKKQQSNKQKYSRKNLIKLPNRKRTRIPILFGINLISTLSKNLNIPKSISEMAITLFRDVSSEDEFKYCQVNVKQCLALCCLYIVCCQENNYIAFSELIKNSDINFAHVGKILIRLQKQHPELFEKGVKKIESLIPYYLFKLDFNDKEKMRILNYANGLIWMWQETCLIQGLNPINIIHVALFYAWKAIDPKRSAITINQFCRKFHIQNQSRSLNKKVNHFLNILIEFVKLCPLFCIDNDKPMDKNLAKNSISLRIEKILSMKAFIVNQYNEQHQINQSNKQNEESILDEIMKSKSNDVEQNETEDIDDDEIDSYIRNDDEVTEILKISK